MLSLLQRVVTPVVTGLSLNPDIKPATVRP